jgi:hypothetical protein
MGSFVGDFFAKGLLPQDLSVLAVDCEDDELVRVGWLNAARPASIRLP